ncbi:MAG TPA: hypothetical protein VFN35_04905 [Ktedonobacteraceae bacterium]|nr:hypothetical protein [Ktedonobacteraceae bacterium]
MPVGLSPLARHAGATGHPHQEAYKSRFTERFTETNAPFATRSISLTRASTQPLL